MLKAFFKWHAYQFCNYNLFGFKDKDLQVEFNEWRSVSELKQIAFITTLTAFLYYLFTFINQYIVLPEMIPIMTFWHLYIVPTLLLFVAILAFKKKFCFLMTASLIFVTIVAAVANIHIVSKFDGFTTYQTELYLMIFWVFTVSGLRLIHALNVALVIVIMSVVSALYIFPMQKNELIMHIFWMLASLSFGFVGAYLLEERQKSLFLSQKELEKSALTDKLTGLYNRKKFDEVIADELEKSKRYKHSFGIIMIDIDYFKNINDTYGHIAGDMVLVEIAEILNKYTRASDISVRWGGEEFIVICLEVNEKTIVSLAENIRQKVEETHFYKTDKVTISVGATISREDDDIDSIIKRADEALYIVKNDEKNRVEVLT